MSTCNICGDLTLICHSSVCIRRTQGVGDYCYTGDRLYCRYGLTCSGSSCTDPATTTASGFAGFDEDCETDNDCYGSFLYCDPFVLKCRLAEQSPPYRCNVEADCPSNNYCALQDTTTSPTIPRQCTASIPRGSRDGTICNKPETATETDSLECGYLYSCQQLNYGDNDARFVKRVCVAPFSLPDGASCSNDNFCESGICSGFLCQSPDTSSRGSACQANSDCSRGMQCSCPTEGGSRSRCSLASNYITHNNNKAELSRQKGYLKCLEDNGCTSISANLGTCGWKNCRSQLSGLTLVNNGGNWYSTSGIYTILISKALPGPIPKCSAQHSSVASYEGWSEMESAASSLSASLGLLAALFVACLALL